MTDDETTWGLPFEIWLMSQARLSADGEAAAARRMREIRVGPGQPPEDDRLRSEYTRIRDMIASHNTHIATRLARGAWLAVRPRPDYLDLVQAGMEGVVEAVDGFDPDSGYRFETWAVWPVSRRIHDFIAEYDPATTPRLPKTHYRDLRRPDRDRPVR